MPISDAEILLRDGSTDLTASELTPTGVHVGPGPIQGMNLRIYVPAAGGSSPTADIIIAQADTLGGTYYDLLDGTVPQITAAGTYMQHIHWTMRYLRHETTVGGSTPDFGAVTIGLVAGEIPTT